MLNKKRSLIALLLFFLFISIGASFGEEIKEKLSPLPYNFRQIDEKVFAGGHPMGPNNNFRNSDKKILEILANLKKLGVKTVIDLENTKSIQKRYVKLLNEAQLERLHIPMNSQKTPTKKEWDKIKSAIEQTVYIHCKWGADRTGSVVGRYLVEEKNYTPQEAYDAVISKGAYAGPNGGLKLGPSYKNLKDFILFGHQE